MKIYIYLLIFLLVSCQQLFYQGTKEKYFDPYKLQLNNTTLSELRFPSKDKTLLHALYFKTGLKPKGLILFFHGNAENITSHFTSLVWLVPHGWDLLAFDYRGYGQSEGESFDRGLYEDSLSALEKAYALQEERTAPHLIVYGQSLGGLIAGKAITSRLPKKKIDLFVFESSFASYQEVAFYHLKHNIFSFLFSPLAYILVSDKYAFAPHVKEIDTPTLVIHGTKDNVIDLSFGQAVYEALTVKKWMWIVPDGGHIDAFWRGNDFPYQKKFLSFLEEQFP